MGNRTKKNQKSEVRSQESEVKIKKSGSEKSKMTIFMTAFFSAILASLLSLLLTSSSSFAEQKNESVPTVITSESLTADNKAKTALFTGSVVAKKSDRTLYADRMLVYYSEAGSGSNIDKIESDGNVKLVRGDRIITSGKMVYYAGNDERAIFTEGPRAAEGKNVVTGTKMTYYMKDDRSVVENSKVFIVEKEAGEQGKKPQDKNQDKKKKK